MLAESQLEHRSRLGLALFSLGRLAEDIALQPNPAQMINSLVAGLKDPFLFVVAGEVNAGKSMLLNALFGEEFCKTSPLPTTDRIHYFRHGFTQRVTELGPMLQEIRLPQPFLHDFHIVDTPGVNSVAEGHEAVTEQFLPRADAILFVLPVTNPWGAKCWEFLRRIHEEFKKRIVIVLQQIDLRSAAEVTAISEHVQRCVKRWIGCELPVFPVSAKQAFLARTTAVGKDELLAASGFPALEAQLNEMLVETKEKLDRLQNTLRMGRIILAQVNTSLAEKASKLAGLGDVLKSVGVEVQDQKANTWEACLKTLKPMDLEIQKGGDVVRAEFTERIDSWPSTFAQNHTATIDEMVALWTKAGEDAIKTHVSSVEKILKMDFSQLWRKTRVPVGQAVGEKLPHESACQPPMDELKESQSQILRDLRSSESWKAGLKPLFDARRKHAVACLAGAGTGLVLLLAGVFAHFISLIVLGVLLMIGMPFLANRLKVRDTKSLVIKLMHLCEQDQKRTRKQADIHLQKWLQRAFQQFSVNFKPLLEVCEKTRIKQEQRVQESHMLKSTFDDLQKIMGC